MRNFLHLIKLIYPQKQINTNFFFYFLSPSTQIFKYMKAVMIQHNYSHMAHIPSLNRIDNIFRCSSISCHLKWVSNTFQIFSPYRQHSLQSPEFPQSFQPPQSLQSLQSPESPQSPQFPKSPQSQQSIQVAWP